MKSGHQRAVRMSMVCMMALAALSACSQPATSWDPWGHTMAQLKEHAPNSGSVVYDISPTLVDLPPAYNEGADQSAWVIVAACGPVRADSTKPVAVAVIPLSSYSPEIRKKTKAHEYTSLLAECS